MCEEVLDPCPSCRDAQLFFEGSIADVEQFPSRPLFWGVGNRQQQLFCAEPLVSVATCELSCEVQGEGVERAHTLYTFQGIILTFYSLYSGNFFYDEFYDSMFNTIVSIFPLIAFSIIDEDFNPDFSNNNDLRKKMDVIFIA